MLEPDERDEMVVDLGAAAAEVMGDAMKNFRVWHGLRKKWMERLREAYEAEGLGNAAGYWESFWAQMFPRSPPRDPAPWLQRLYALATRCEDLFWRHIEDRKRDAGNVFIQIAANGKTGIGKSTLALGIVEEDRPWKKGQLRRHLTYDQARAPELLSEMEPLEWLIFDDESRLGGDNSKVTLDEMKNMEDQTRASQKHTIVIAPDVREHETVQLLLEVFAWSLERQKVASFLVVEDVPLGVIVRPFCSSDAWGEYGPIKAEQVERAVAAMFRDSGAAIRFVNKLSEKKQVRTFLVGRRKKPKKKDFENAIKMFDGRQIATRTLATYKEVWFTVAYNWDVYGKDDMFRETFGIEPSPGLVEIAKACSAGA